MPSLLLSPFGSLTLPLAYLVGSLEKLATSPFWTLVSVSRVFFQCIPVEGSISAGSFQQS